MTRKVFLGLLALALTFSVGLMACGGAGEQEEEEEEEEEIDMEGAINIVVEDILPAIPEIQAGGPYQCIKLDSSLPEGAVIEEYWGDTPIILDQEKFFFYLDLAPGEAYAHDVKYILVDMNGNHEEHDAKWWTLIDGEVPEELIPDMPDQTDVIAANLPWEPAAGTNPIYYFPVLSLRSCEGFLVVKGAIAEEKYHDAFLVSYFDAKYFFEEYAEAHASACSDVWSMGLTSDAAGVLDVIDDMAEDGFDPITIFITAHGNVDGFSCGGVWITANDVRNTLAAHPDTTFNFMLHSCYSGSFIDDLDDLDNVCVVVTAVAANQIATAGDIDNRCGMIDYNQYDQGNEWISSILEAMSEIVSDESRFDDIREWADEWNVPETSVLINAGHFGAIGRFSHFGLTQDLDLSHRWGYECDPPRYHDPQMLCTFPICSIADLS